MLTRIYLRLLSFLKPYMKQVIFVWIIVAAAASFTMVQPKLLQWAVDTGLKPQSNTEVVSDVPATANVIPVKSAQSLSAGDVLRIRKEKVTVTSVEGKNLTVQRGSEGTEPQVLVAGSRVSAEVQKFGGKFRTLLLAGGAIVAAAALRGFFTYWQTFIGEGLGQHVAFDLSNKIYEKLQRLSYA